MLSSAMFWREMPRELGQADLLLSMEGTCTVENAHRNSARNQNRKGQGNSFT